MMQLDVKYEEALLGRAIKSIGGKWNEKEGAWEFPYKQVLAFGLEERLVKSIDSEASEKTEKISNTGNIRQRASPE